MTEPHVLVIGAGPAGLAAAIELVQLGLRVTLIEQRDQVGGAIYRQPHAHAAHSVPLPASHQRPWHALSQGLAQAGERIEQRFECVFIGVDRDGRCLLDDRRAGRVVGLRAQALIVATGTVEQVQPRPGWELPGVSSAGGLQVQLKETGLPPQGPVLLAGSGPLLLALAAQLTAAGNPPVAVLERGQPLRTLTRHPLAAWALLRAPHYLSDAVGYSSQLLRAGVPYRTGWSVDRIDATSDGELAVACSHVHGAKVVHHVQHLALHDGLQPNTPGPSEPTWPGLLLEQAGDSREVLGAHAAVADGRRAAHSIATRLGRAATHTATLAVQLAQNLAAERRTQATLKTLLQAPTPALTPDTVLCRCEGLRLRDLQALEPDCSAKERKLYGRFGMGACQGRFCQHTVQAQAGPQSPGPTPAEAEVPRWPWRPVSVAALAAYAEGDET